MNLSITNTKVRVRWTLAALLAVLALAFGAIPAISEAPPTFGTIPDEAWVDDGSVNMDIVPDFVAAEARDGSLAGYVSAQDILGEAPSASHSAIPVVDKNLDLVGHMVPGRGFVPVGQPFDSVERFPRTVYEGLADGTIQVTEINPDGSIKSTEIIEGTEFKP